MFAARRSAMSRSCSVEATARAILRGCDARVRSPSEAADILRAMTWTPITEEPVRGGYPPVGLLGLPGPERAQAFADGLMPRPPISHLFGLRPQARTADEAVFTMPSSGWLQTSFGVFFASTAVLAADAPFGSALVPSMEPGMYGTTSEVSMSFLRPASPSSGLLTARAHKIDAGRTLGLSQATVSDARGRI